MKYIKLFESFDQYDLWNSVSMKKIKQDIADMFIELTDEGYIIRVSEMSNDSHIKKNGSLRVYIEGENDWFFFDEISDTVSMLIDYFESEFDDIKVTFSYERYKSSFDYVKRNKQEVMNEEDKHFLVSYFSVKFEKVNKKL